MTMGSSLSAVAMFNNTSFARIRLVRDADANRGDRCFELDRTFPWRHRKSLGLDLFNRVLTTAAV
jgi:hypothetical protein